MPRSHFTSLKKCFKPRALHASVPRFTCGQMCPSCGVPDRFLTHGSAKCPSVLTHGPPCYRSLGSPKQLCQCTPNPELLFPSSASPEQSGGSFGDMDEHPVGTPLPFLRPAHFTSQVIARFQSFWVEDQLTYWTQATCNSVARLGSRTKETVSVRKLVASHSFPKAAECIP